jgi:crotonobetainyl-CoA:carnitine CoA-transferase CaiB-like acyl-CoA transferase
MHACFATLVALAERDATGEGMLVESAMVEGALNAAAEQVVEFTAYGNLLQREGNRCPEAAPQGLYPCRGHSAERPRWLALSVASDAQWLALIGCMGAPAWADTSDFATLAGRRAAHDDIDEEIRAFTADRERDTLVDALIAAGVPAAAVADPRESSGHPQLAARGFFERISHPVAGTHPIPTVPFRYAGVAHWIRFAAPTVGQHNREILVGELGISESEFAALEDDGIIGVRPSGK